MIRCLCAQCAFIAVRIGEFPVSFGISETEKCAVSLLMHASTVAPVETAYLFVLSFYSLHLLVGPFCGSNDFIFFLHLVRPNDNRIHVNGDRRALTRFSFLILTRVSNDDGGWC